MNYLNFLSTYLSLMLKVYFLIEIQIVDLYLLKICWTQLSADKIYEQSPVFEYSAVVEFC